jgi:hypothetical protein
MWGAENEHAVLMSQMRSFGYADDISQVPQGDPMTQLTRLAARDELLAPQLAVPFRRSRARRWSRRLGTVAAACAMGSWALLVVIPLLVFLSWISDLHLS